MIHHIEIPNEIYAAQENGKLVLFCGAGISRDAGLPGFQGLVRQILEQIDPATLTDIQPLEESKRAGNIRAPDTPLRQAFISDKYDLTLELLEQKAYGAQRRDGNLIKRTLIEKLQLSDKADTSYHADLLKLATNADNSVRLVTTNFDRGFVTENNKQALIDAAPKLPVAKASKWNSIVHLHGLIDTGRDPDGANLVVTSSDFGCAYLTERWAARFVTELFRNFTVVFIGYSVNDPILRYVTDAIAADIRTDKIGNKPYAFIPVDELPRWETKPIKPISFSKDEDGNYTILRDTIRKWASDWSTGIREPFRAITWIARTPPASLHTVTPEQRYLIDSLRNFSNTDNSETNRLLGLDLGSKAAHFANISEPAAPIGWLELFDQEGLLGPVVSDNETHCRPLAPGSNMTFKRPSPVSRKLWWWLTKHLDKQELANWVIEKGGMLHPEFKELIRRTLRENDPEVSDYLKKFWQLLISQDAVFFYDDTNINYLCHDFIENPTVLLLKSLMRPRLKIRKSVLWPSGESKETGEFKFNALIDLPVNRHVLSKIHEAENYPADFLHLLGPAQTILQDIMYQWQAMGLAGPDFDRSARDLPSIEPSDQNQLRHYNNWPLLIEFIRNLWLETWQVDQREAYSLFRIWQTLPFPVFRRLAMFAMYSIEGIVTPDEAIRFLLEGDGKWLWSKNVHHEKCQLLKTFGPQFSEEETDRLTTIILRGPPRNKYKHSVTDEEFKDRAIFEAIKRAKRYGITFNQHAEDALSSIATKYPDWGMPEGEADEFNSYMSVSITSASFIPNNVPYDESFLQASVEEQLDKLLAPAPKDRFGRPSGNHAGWMTDLVQSQSETCLRILKYGASVGSYDTAVWQSTLKGLFHKSDEQKTQNDADLSEFLWPEIKDVIIGAPDTLKVELALDFARWCSHVADHIEDNTFDEEDFWELWQHLVQFADTGDAQLTDDVLNEAINTAMGVYTEALLKRFGKRQYQPSEGLRDEIRRHLEALLAGTADVYVFAKVIIASRANFLFHVDPVWTDKHVVPLLKWSDDPYTIYYWQGFLLTASLGKILVERLQGDFLMAVAKFSEHENTWGSQTMNQLFAIACLEEQASFDGDKLLATMDRLPVDDKKDVLWMVWRSLEGGQDRDAYWEKLVRPFFTKYWPTNVDYKSPAITPILVNICFACDQHFSDAVDLLTPKMQADMLLSGILQLLERTIHAQEKRIDGAASDILRVIQAAMSEENSILLTQGYKLLETIINTSLQNTPTLEKDPTIARLRVILDAQRPTPMMS